MEIKQGDKVRILDNVPEIYTQTIFSVHIPMEMEVVKVQDGSARIRPILSGLSGLSFEYIIPCKYLVKVDAEAKETKYNEGEKVRYNGYVYEVEGLVGKDRYSLKGLNFDLHEDMIDTYEPHTEPTEKTEAEEDARIRQMEAELDEFKKAELDRMLHPEKYYTYEVKIDNVAMNWQRYEADLAKEVALKVANKYNDPKQAAEYAVSVAKGVVEGLKEK